MEPNIQRIIALAVARYGERCIPVCFAVLDALEKQKRYRSIPEILEVALALQGGKMTAEERAAGAIEIWLRTKEALRERKSKQVPRNPKSYGPDVQLCSMYDGGFKGMNFLEKGEPSRWPRSHTLLCVKSFEHWLDVIMPQRKKADRLTRFRRCIAEVGDVVSHVDDAEWVDAELLRWKNHKHFSDPERWFVNIRIDTTLFILWDDMAQAADLRKRARKGTGA